MRQLPEVSICPFFFLVWPGAVFWAPPAEAITEAAAHALEPPYSQYGSDEGMLELRTALEQKVRNVNKLERVRSPCQSRPLCTSASQPREYISIQQDVCCLVLPQALVLALKRALYWCW